MTKLRVLVADDSLVYRSQIRKALEMMPEVEVVGMASSGRLALDRLSVSPIDLMLLDLEMPELNGFETLKLIKERKYQCTVLVFSSHSFRGAEMTLEALKLGAADFVPKPSAESFVGTEPHIFIHNLIAPKIRGLFPVSNLNLTSPSKSNWPSTDFSQIKPDIVLIGSSTGGPTVLETIISGLKVPLHCPIVITQHMPPLFTKTFAERLGKLGGRPSHEAKNGQKIEVNNIYVAPGDYHLTLEKSSVGVFCHLDQKPQIHSVRPAVDPLFTSAATIYKKNALAIVLTGMGCDGRDGAIEIKKHGGSVIIQEQKSCVVFGMPGAVYQANAYDKILTPLEIQSFIVDKCGHSEQLKMIS